MIFVQTIPCAPQTYVCHRSPHAPCVNRRANGKDAIAEKTPIHRVETDEKAVISMDVAGYSEDQLDISIDSHVLSVNGSRTNKLQDVFVLSRRFALKQDVYDEHKISAVLSDGVLELTLSKKPVLKSRKIPISVAQAVEKNEESDGIRETDSPSILVETVNEDDDHKAGSDSWEEVHTA